MGKRYFMKMFLPCLKQSSQVTVNNCMGFWQCLYLSVAYGHALGLGSQMKVGDAAGCTSMISEIPS
jgi:hypothetical protein